VYIHNCPIKQWENESEIKMEENRKWQVKPEIAKIVIPPRKRQLNEDQTLLLIKREYDAQIEEMAMLRIGEVATLSYSLTQFRRLQLKVVQLGLDTPEIKVLMQSALLAMVSLTASMCAQLRTLHSTSKVLFRTSAVNEAFMEILDDVEMQCQELTDL
jgi:hypothetical protein